MIELWLGILDFFSDIAYYLAMNHQNINFFYWQELSNHVKKVDLLMIFGQIIIDISKKVRNAQLKAQIITYGQLRQAISLKGIELESCSWSQILATNKYFPTL